MSMKLRDGVGRKLAVFATTVALSGVAALVPVIAVADHSTSHTIEQLSAQIAVLQAQLAALAGAGAGGGAGAGACSFSRDLTVGARGDDVTCLQNYLTSTGHFTFSGGATGYFGSVTKASVAAWQSSNGVSPAAGYFGPISRAKYSAVAGGAPGVPGVPAPGVPAGKGLTVSPGLQPASTLLPGSAARAPVVKVVLTASADGDVTVNGLTIERQGLADDSGFKDLILFDENGIQIGLAKTLNALHRATFNEKFVVKAGTSRTITVGANMDTLANLGGETGQVAKFAVVAVDAGSSVVSGALPIVGNGMTINNTLTIGGVTMTRGVTDPGSDRAALEVGSKAYIFAAVRATADSAEDMTLESVRFNQSGSAANADMANLKVDVGGTKYDASVSSDGKYYTAVFGSGILIPKGAVKEIAIMGDVESGSDRTISFDILRKTDIVARGNNFGYYVTPGGGSTGTSDGNFSTDTEPFYNSYDVTVSKGTLRVEKSNNVAAGNVPVDVSNTPLGAFLFEAKGEKVQVTSIKFNFGLTDSDAGGEISGVDIDSVALYDSSGAVVAGPKDVISDGSVTYTDSWTIPVGTSVYTLKGKLTTDFENNDTVTASTTPSGATARGETTGLTISPTPGSAISANAQTVKSASVSVSVSPDPAAQNVVRGINGYLFAKYQVDATASGEDVRVTSMKGRVTYTGTPGTTDLNTCTLFDGATALNTGTNVSNPTLDATSPDDVTFTFDNHLIVPKGTTKVVELKCNISGNAKDASTHAWGINSGVTDAVVAVGKDTGVALTESVTTATGQVMTVKTGGSLTVALDSSSPSERLGLAGKTDVLMAVMKLTSKDEAIKMNQVGLQLDTNTASTSDVLKVTIWDGATKVGESVFTGITSVATTTFTGSFVVPKDGDKLLTIKADLASLGTNQPARRGDLVVVTYDGDNTTATEGTGQSSGSKINPAAITDPAAKGVRLVKSILTLEKLAVPSNTLINADMALYRFKATADAAGDVGLAKIVLLTSTSGVVVQSYNVYGYSDSGFSVNAYASNPITKDSRANLAMISGTQMEVYFNPVNGGGGQEAVQIPAGSSRYFEVRATVSLADAGDSATVQVEGDAAVTDNNTTGRVVFSDVDDDTDDDLIWSPNTTTSAATTTNDWLNGYLVPGLPNTNMSSQSLTK